MVLQDGLKPFFHLAPPPQLLKQFNDFLPATVFCIYTDRGTRRRGGAALYIFLLFFYVDIHLCVKLIILNMISHSLGPHLTHKAFFWLNFGKRDFQEMD